MNCHSERSEESKDRDSSPVGLRMIESELSNSRSSKLEHGGSMTYA